MNWKQLKGVIFVNRKTLGIVALAFLLLGWILALPALAGPNQAVVLSWLQAQPLLEEGNGTLPFQLERSLQELTAEPGSVPLRSDSLSVTVNPLDNWTWRNPLPQGNSLLSAAYGNGRFLAVGYQGAAVTSPDGLAWSLCRTGTTVDLWGVTYANGIFVAVGTNGTIRVTTDGTTWVAAGSGTSQDLFGVSYGNGSFVAVGANGTVLTSPDAAVWTPRFSGTARVLEEVAFGEGLFVAVGQGGGLYTSPDGISWTPRTSGTGLSLFGVAYGNGDFVVSGENGYLISSPDGISWTKRTSGVTAYLFSVTYGSGGFVAAGATPGGNAVILNSLNGITWTSVTAGTNLYLAGSANGGGYYVVVGQGGILLSSSNGTSWQIRSQGTSSFLRDVVCGTVGLPTLGRPVLNDFSLPYRFLAVGDGGTILLSQDALIWKAQYSGISTALRGVTFGNGSFMAVGDSGAILTSPDGITWTRRIPGVVTEVLRGVAYGAQLFAVVGDGGKIMTSPEGVVWTSRFSGTEKRLYRCRYFNGKFLAVGEAGTLLTSEDGIIWSARVSVTEKDLFDVCFGGNGFVAVGADGACLTSVDAITWTPQNLGITADLYGIVWHSGTFVAVDEGGHIRTSTSGTIWSLRNSPTNNVLRSVTFGNDMYVTVGATGTILTAAAGGPVTVVVDPVPPSTPVGQAVILNISSTNIEVPEYQVWIQDPRDGAWSNLGPYSRLTSYAFTRTVPGIYQILVYAKAEDAPYSSAVSSEFTPVTFTKESAVSALVVTGPNGAQPVGISATFTASATDLGGTPLYQFWLHDASGWRVVQDYSTTNTYTLSDLAAGSYVIAVYALDQLDIAAGNWTAAYYQVFILNVGSSVSLTGPTGVPLGWTASFTAVATGLTGAEYQFWYQAPDSSWHQSGAYSTSGNFDLLTTQTGTYRIIVYAKDHYAPATDQFSVYDVKELSVS